MMILVEIGPSLSLMFMCIIIKSSRTPILKIFEVKSEAVLLAVVIIKEKRCIVIVQYMESILLKISINRGFLRLF